MFSPVLSVAAKYPDHVGSMMTRLPSAPSVTVRFSLSIRRLMLLITVSLGLTVRIANWRAHSRACLDGRFGNFRRRSTRKRTRSELKTALSTSDTRAGRAVSAKRSNGAADIAFFVNTPIVRMQTPMPPAAGVIWTAVRRAALRKILRFSSRNRRIRQTRPMRLRPSS